MNGRLFRRITKHLLSNVMLLLIIFTFAGAKLANGQVSEAERIALKYTAKLLAPTSLTTLIENHLTQIRAKYPQVADVRHQGKWVPGEVLVKGVDAAGVDQITASRYGPLRAAIPLSSTYHLVFSRLYNPEKHAIILVRHYDLESDSGC